MTESLEKNLRIDALIFDVDGVLIDVSRSYRQAIIQTVDLFFNYALGLDYEGEVQPLIDNRDIDLLKQAGGFNNDWDLTTAFITYFLEMLPPHSVITMPLKKHVPAVLAYLQVIGSNYRVTMDQLHQNKNIERLSRGIGELGGGLPAIGKLLKRRNRHLLSTGSGILEGNLIQRTFQELYLGEALFQEVYGTPAVVVQKKPGLIDNETLLIDPAVLEVLSGHISLGIATGRPKVEAEYSLKRLKIGHFFQSLVTYDDLLAANAKGKPHPWSLLEAARRIRPLPARSAYIGDTLDDVLAAKAANESVPFVAIGSLAVAEDKQGLRQRFEAQRADIILGHPNGLKDLILR